jgi:hypothetical protein
LKICTKLILSSSPARTPTIAAPSSFILSRSRRCWGSSTLPARAMVTPPLAGGAPPRFWPWKRAPAQSCGGGDGPQQEAAPASRKRGARPIRATASRPMSGRPAAAPLPASTTAVARASSSSPSPLACPSDPRGGRRSSGVGSTGRRGEGVWVASSGVGSGRRREAARCGELLERAVGLSRGGTEGN